jgi:hypothetical protein
MTCKDKVSRYAVAFNGYFILLGLCMDVKPEWLGWYWGVVDLVFQVC